MLKDEFCTRRGLLCVILRGRFVFWVFDAGKAFIRIEKECTTRCLCGSENLGRFYKLSCDGFAAIVP